MITHDTLSAARAQALATSQQYPTEYVVIGNCFGWIVHRMTRALPGDEVL